VLPVDLGVHAAVATLEAAAGTGAGSPHALRAGSTGIVAATAVGARRLSVEARAIAQGQPIGALPIHGSRARGGHVVGRRHVGRGTGH